MAEKKPSSVTMRIRVGDNELEVTGPTEFVEKKIAEFIELNKTVPLARSVPPQLSGRPPVEKATESTKTLSLAQFFRKANPRTDYDKALAAGYYLEFFRKMENFTSAEIRDAIQKEAKTQPPVNPSDATSKNIKKGYMMSAGDKDGKRAFVLTSDGEDAVREMLQD